MALPTRSEFEPYGCWSLHPEMCRNYRAATGQPSPYVSIRKIGTRVGTKFRYCVAYQPFLFYPYSMKLTLCWWDKWP